MRVAKAVAFIAFLGLSSAFAYFYWSINTPIDVTNTSAAVFVVPKGASLNELGNRLQQEGFIRNALTFKIWIKLQPNIPEPKAGKHEIYRAMSVPKLLAILASKPLSEDVPVTMLPGWRLRDADKYLASRALSNPGEYVEAASDKTRYELKFVVEGDTLAGYLWPDTYLVPPGKANLERLIQRQLNAFYERFYQPYEEEIRNSKRSLHQIVIMASILEREEPKPQIRPIVAGILYKRYDKGIPLGVDATSRFGLDDWNDRQAFLKMLRDQTDPYNTRERPGLPPGPIGEPGLDSLVGALRPISSPFFYYLHDEHGEIHFARDNAGHESNRRRYNVW